MDKKQAIINTLFGKIQERSKKLFEDVSDEIWNDIVPTDEDTNPEVDYTLEVDGEEIETEPETTETALDVILNNEPKTYKNI